MCIAKETRLCKHIAALIHRINYDRSVSKTSVEQEWGAPSVRLLAKEQYSTGITLNELYEQRTIKKNVPAFNFTKEHVGDIECPVSKRLKIEDVPEDETVCRVISDISLLEREEEI